MNMIFLNDSAKVAIEKLINSSHERPMDCNSVLPWQNGVDRTKPPKKPEQSWIFGTSYYDALSDEQRQELLWQEISRDISMFITLEQTLPPLYVGYINKFGEDISKDVYEYLMIFSKEEIVHTLMFRRFLKAADLNLFNPPDGLHELLTHQLPTMRPEAGMACTLIIEWVAELGAMYCTQGDEIEPLTRKMFYEHHIDESRHIAFGRWVTESYLDKAPAEEANAFRGLLRGLMARLVPQFTYNPEIVDHLPFSFPIARTDEAKIAEVRNSAANVALNEKRFAPLNNWLKKVQVL